MTDEVLSYFAPDSPKLIVLQYVELAPGHARPGIGLTYKYQWVDQVALPDTEKNRKYLVKKGEVYRQSGYYSRIVLRDNPDYKEMEYFIEHTK